MNALTVNVRITGPLADHVDSIAHRATDELVGHRQAAMLRLLDDELPNIRAVLEVLRDRGDMVGEVWHTAVEK